jgi:hypothetical protein
MKSEAGIWIQSGYGESRPSKTKLPSVEEKSKVRETWASLDRKFLKMLRRLHGK